MTMPSAPALAPAADAEQAVIAYQDQAERAHREASETLTHAQLLSAQFHFANRLLSTPGLSRAMANLIHQQIADIQESAIASLAEATGGRRP